MEPLLKAGRNRMRSRIYETTATFAGRSLLLSLAADLQNQQPEEESSLPCCSNIPACVLAIRHSTCIPIPPSPFPCRPTMADFSSATADLRTVDAAVQVLCSFGSPAFLTSFPYSSSRTHLCQCNYAKIANSWGFPRFPHPWLWLRLSGEVVSGLFLE